MLTSHAVSAAALAALALFAAACSRKEAANAPEPAAADAPASTAAATAPTAPRLRAGLWEVTMTSEDGPTGASRMCLDDAVQARMNVIGAEAAGGACQQTSMSPNPGGGWRFRSVCDHSAMGGGASVTEGVMTGDLRTGYSSRSTVTTTGAEVAHMNGATTVSAQGVYKGACPPDWKPGDMEIPGGMRFNMVEMADGAEKMAR